MPHRQLPDLLFMVPPYLAGIIVWVSNWSNEHPYLHWFALLLGPALGYCVKWLLNRYQSSTHMWRQARAYRQRLDVYRELFGPLPASIEEQLEPETPRWQKLKSFWRRSR